MSQIKTAATKPALQKSVSFSHETDQVQEARDRQEAAAAERLDGRAGAGGEESRGNGGQAGCFACFGFASQRVRVAKSHCRQAKWHT